VIGNVSPGAKPLSPRDPRGAQRVDLHSQRGITLIELVIALFILGVLTTVAVSNYREYVRRANITAALEQLDRYGIRMTKAYHDSGNYGIGTCAVNLPASVRSFNFGCQLSQVNQGFTATATGTGDMAGFSFSLNNDAAHATTSFPGVTTPANCWMVQRSGCL